MTVVTCSNPAPVLGDVQFSFAEFEGVYPEFTGIGSGPAAQAFAMATLQLNPLCSSRVLDANQRQSLLYLLTAHILFLSNGTNDGAGNITPPPGIVGRIDSAAEGAVNVSAEMSSTVTQSQAYYVQTKYGAQYWQAIAPYRTMAYVPAPCSPSPALGAFALGPFGSGPFGGGPGCGC